MDQLFRLSETAPRDSVIDAWLLDQPPELGEIAREWFARIRAVGDDIREAMHDGRPTACVADAAFAYVNVFTAHVNVGLFLGSELDDPAGLLEGTGRNMRHVKVRPGATLDPVALSDLIDAAYHHTKWRLTME